VTKHNDRHLTTEELSALLDGQISEQEQAICDAHLETCKQCRLALADLRQTVSLLRTLPQPELPRSFVLPTSVSYIQERHGTDMQTSPAPSAPDTDPQERQGQRTRTSTFRRSARILSLLVAVIGLFILASGVFAILPRFSNSAGTASSSANTSVHNASPSNTENKPHQVTNGKSPSSSATVQKTSAPSLVGVGTPGAHATLTPSPTPTATATKATTSQTGPALALPNLTTPLGQQEVGFPLFVLGIIGLLLTRRKRSNENGT
jgi:anti-sigma factor RsiW